MDVLPSENERARSQAIIQDLERQVKRLTEHVKSNYELNLQISKLQVCFGASRRAKPPQSLWVPGIPIRRLSYQLFQ